MPEAPTATAFAGLPLGEQLDAWLGPGTHAPLATLPAGDVTVRRARRGQHDFVLVAFDHGRQHGSIGPREADQIGAALALAVRERLPLVLLVNTSGMRVTEGMRTVAALRTLLRALLDAKLDGQRLFALVTRHAFGGASMMTALCDRKLLQPRALLAMSGPKLIESAAGSHALRAADPVAVSALIGGEARAACMTDAALVPEAPAACADALDAWLATAARAPEPAASRGERLRVRLADRVPPLPQPVGPDALDPVTAAMVARLLPFTPSVLRSGTIVLASSPSAPDTLVCGLTTGAATTAPAAWLLADRLLEFTARRSGARIHLLADTGTHSADPADERVVLSEYMTHLALTLRELHRRGHEVHVIVTGVAGGGIFAALAAGATRVSMRPSARIQVLAPGALAAIAKRADAEDETLAAAVAAGAVDGAFPESSDHA